MKRYVLVGCGNRGVESYAVSMVKNFKDCAQLCGVYDINYKRAELVSKMAGEDIPVFYDFQEMLEKVEPDVVIVTTVDCYHDEYVIAAMNAGCDVIVEKPLTMTFEKSLAIKEAQERTGKNITVTFNLRFHPFFSRLKKIVASGILGDQILSVHYEWMVGVQHGADYFRRWHAERKNSGSLLVHKSTHHFDIANWLLEQDPVSVYAVGTQRYFGPTREKCSERCLTCPYKQECEFYFDVQSPEFKEMYYDCEDVDGYYRDRCVFSDRTDIEDSVSVSVLYSGGTVMSYSLTAHSPYEGMRIVLNGNKGRMEATTVENHVKIYNHNGEEYDISLPKDGTGDHGGADDNLLNSLFRGHEPETIGQMADLRAGMMSIGIGMAANISMKEKRRVDLNEFYN